MNILRSITAAFSFLTIVPVKKTYSLEVLGKACAFFPLIGLLIGIVAGSCSLLHNIEVSTHLIAATAVIIPLILTGGLHFDGLLDSFDGLYGQREKQKRLEIMRDSSNGAIGILSGFIVLLLKYSLIISLPQQIIFPALISACVFSRYVMSACCCYMPYARPEGKGDIFTTYASHTEFAISSTITLASLVLVCKTQTFFIAAVSLFLSLTFIFYVYKKIQGVTGDTLGAINEISELAVLTSFYCTTLL